MRLLTIAISVVTCLFLSGLYQSAAAQNEIQRERSSLKGIQEMGFSLNLEYNASVGQQDELEISSIRKDALDKLTGAGIDILSDRETRLSDQAPLIYMHINTMDAGRGLIPYSVSIRFYQPVRLTLNRDLATTASTWETGLVGLVSYDRLDVIKQSAVNLLQDFIDDYNRINGYRQSKQ